jgi:hypothetical protein
MMTIRTALVRRSILSISLDGGKGYTGRCRTEAEWEHQVSLVQAGGYEIVDLDAHDAETGRELPSDAWAWRTK